MNDRCATEPLQLPDGTVIQPDEPMTLQRMCEIFPVMFEIELEKVQAKTQAQARPGVRAGSPVGLAPSSAPAGFQSPGQISPFGSPGGGPSSGPGGGGGGGGLPGGGGGGRRRVQQGTQGPPGPPGPAGPGGISPGKIKVDGDYSVGPNGDWTPIPGTDFIFTQGADGSAYFFIQAVFGTTGIACCDVSGQIGLRIDGIDYPLTLDYFNTFVAGVGPIASPGPAFWPAPMAAGDHTVEIVIRGINRVATGVTQNTALIILANPVVPLAVGVIHG